MSYKEAIDWHHNSCYSQRTKNWLLPNGRLFLKDDIHSCNSLLYMYVKKASNSMKYFCEMNKMQEKFEAWSNSLKPCSRETQFAHKIHNSSYPFAENVFFKVFLWNLRKQGLNEKNVAFSPRNDILYKWPLLPI